MNNSILLRSILLILAVISIQATCNYTFKDVSIPPEVKTVRVNYIENRARYINPQLSPQLTDKLRQKITGQTRLTLINSDDAHYDISGYITDFSVNTSGISGKEASSNNLNITVHVIFKNRLDEKKNFETDITRNFPFSASLSFTDAQNRLMDDILKNVSDDIFNKIFSNW
ncbi:MAG TPA: LptE family protein [Agriterribacter sp.]|nr:LptE family protein [Chitinophagaceae bacterium]HRP31713.1 LptE family protein [Agriterribacter sp.]